MFFIYLYKAILQCTTQS